MDCRFILSMVTVLLELTAQLVRRNNAMSISVSPYALFQKEHLTMQPSRLLLRPSRWL